MFGFGKRKKDTKIILASPVKGEAVSLTEVNDPTFSEGMLGNGIAVIPKEGEIYAPADGEISVLFETLHAISMKTVEGAEILIHVGLDTVKNGGKGFEAHVKTGDTVKKGDLLLSVDLELLKAAGYDIVTPVVICNTDDYKEVTGVAKGMVETGEDLIAIQLN